jgi:hypothetical protein
MNDEIGIKYDDEKPCMGFLFKSFPNALRKVSKQNDYGAKKYSPMNWKKVSIERYEDALSRHLVAALENPNAIDESGQEHLAAVAWNAMALIELKHGQKND